MLPSNGNSIESYNRPIVCLVIAKTVSKTWQPLHDGIALCKYINSQLCTTDQCLVFRRLTGRRSTCRRPQSAKKHCDCSN